MSTLNRIASTTPERVYQICRGTARRVATEVASFRDFNRFMTYSKKDVAEQLVRKFNNHRFRTPDSDKGHYTKLTVQLPATLVDGPYARKIEAALSSEVLAILNQEKVCYDSADVTIQRDTYDAETSWVQLKLAVVHK